MPKVSVTENLLRVTVNKRAAYLVAAALLVEEGHEVVGAPMKTFCFSEQPGPGRPWPYTPAPIG